MMTIERMVSDWMTNQSQKRAPLFCRLSQRLRVVCSAAGGSGVGGELAVKSDMAVFRNAAACHPLLGKTWSGWQKNSGKLVRRGSAAALTCCCWVAADLLQLAGLEPLSAQSYRMPRTR